MDVHTKYRPMRWNTPLSEAHAERLLRQLDPRDGQHIVDLGCGWGELLMRALTRAGPRAYGLGVETETAHLERARHAASERGIGDTVKFREMPAADWRGQADRLICIGSSHAFGDLESTLDACAGNLATGGILLLGEGYWQRPPSQAALDIFGEDIPTLAGLLERCGAAGWRATQLSTAEQSEWDEFESASLRGTEDWCATLPQSNEQAELSAWVNERKRAYREDYRGILGFAYLILIRA